LLFNSFAFAGTFLVVYAVYAALGRWHRAQNLWLLAASLFFYGYWDWRFLSLMLLSIAVDWFVAQRVADASAKEHARRWMWVSVSIQLGILGFFKYFGFFVDSAARLLELAGLNIAAPALNIVLPVGISFYTFQTMSYTIDVYRGHLEPVRRFSDFALYISFFPQLVAGPIERATHLVPQVLEKRKITMSGVYAGIYLVVVGLFKKVVVADNLARTANRVFDNYEQYSGIDTVLGALAFTFQIYGDFSGYSDIARGLAKVMGFDLMLNFRLPYFATSPSDFWRRWHISLSTWLRDYLYIALGGNRRGEFFTWRNLMLTMLLGGLWHGAAWNFVLWGIYHGFFLVLYRFGEQFWGRLGAASRVPRWLSTAVAMALMFVITVGGWILFRAQSGAQVFGMLGSLGLAPSQHSADFALELALFACPLVVAQAALQWRGDLGWPLRWPAWLLGVFEGLLIAAMMVFGVRESMEFIYFQF
jgi:D-alanyl-lipoteichoic acid acyltransferase DltB (MBOAT superfamily)